MRPAWSIIFFTSISGLGFGLAAWVVLGFIDLVHPQQIFGVGGLVMLLIGAGLLSSTLHLGHPERAWRALSQWRSSWLSREGVLAVLAMLALAGWGWHVFVIRHRGERLIVRGRAKLLDNAPEIADLERIKSLFDDLERKRDIAEFLDLTDRGDGVRIFIGSENKLFSLTGSSLVVSPYMNSERKIIGAVGVIGPTRINYGRIVPIVDYTAQLVGKLISDRA